MHLVGKQKSILNCIFKLQKCAKSLITAKILWTLRNNRELTTHSRARDFSSEEIHLVVVFRVVAVAITSSSISTSVFGHERLFQPTCQRHVNEDSMLSNKFKCYVIIEKCTRVLLKFIRLLAEIKEFVADNKLLLSKTNQ